MRIGQGLHTTQIRNWVGEFNPESLFDDTDVGGMYDPSDLTSMFAERTGGNFTNPDPGDTVGIILDKSRMGGMSAGAYIDSLTDVAAVSGGLWGGGSAPAEYVGGVTVLSSANYNLGDAIWLQYRIVLREGSNTFRNNGNGSNFANNFLGVADNDGETNVSILLPDTAKGDIAIGADVAGSYGEIADLVVKVIPGNHLVAPSDDARPVLRDEIVDGADVDVSGATELLTNGDFSDGGTGWSDISTVLTASFSNGQAQIPCANGDTLGGIGRGFTGGTANTWYKVEVDIASLEDVDGVRVGLGSSLGANEFGIVSTDDAFATAGVHSAVFNSTGSSGTFYVSLYSEGDAAGAKSGAINNSISVKEVPAEPSRRYYLEFDGTDDALATDSLDVTGAILSAAWAGSAAFDADSDALFEVSEAARTDSVFQVKSEGSSGPSDLQCVLFNAAFATAMVAGDEAVTSDEVMTLFVDTAGTDDFNLRRDGASRSSTYDDKAGTWNGGTLTRLALSSRSTADGEYEETNCYGFILIDRILTTSERQKLEIYLANKSGVTLDSSSTSSFPALLYDANTGGGVYDTSDLTSMWGHRVSGTSTINAPFSIGCGAGDTVGSMLDKSQMGGQSFQTWLDAQDNATGFTSFTPVAVGTGTLVDNGDGTYTFTDTVGGQNRPGIKFADTGGLQAEQVGAGWWYFKWTITSMSLASGLVRISSYSGGSDYFQGVSEVGEESEALLSPATANYYPSFLVETASSTNGDTFTMRLDRVVWVPGNHLVAPSDAARPVLRDEIVDGTSVDLTGATELVSNPGPDFTATTGWSENRGGGTISVVGGKLRLTSTAGGTCNISSEIAETVNKWYLVEFSINQGTATTANLLRQSDTTVSLSTVTNLSETLAIQDNSGKRLYLSTDTDAQSWVGFVNTFGGAGEYTDLVSFSVKEVPASANRRYYLEQDGTDDQLNNLALAGIDPTNDVTIGAGWNSFENPVDGTTMLTYEADSPDGSTTYLAWDLMTAARVDLVTPGQDIVSAKPGDSDYDSNVLVIEHLTAGPLTSWFNGDVSGTQAAGSSRAGYTGDWVFMTGSGSDAGWSWSAIAFADRSLTYSEREELEEYLGRKAGSIDFDTAWDPASLFENSEDGAIYDPSDSTSMSANRASRTITSKANFFDAEVGGTVGTIFDKSQMGGQSVAGFIASADELATNGGFDTDSDWTKGAGWTISGGVASHSGAVGNLSQTCLESGKWYALTWTQGTSTFVAIYGGTVSNLVSNEQIAGTFTAFFISDGTDIIFRTNVDASIDNISIKELPGNHLVAPSDAARPVLQRDDNKKLYLDFDGTDDRLDSDSSVSIGSQPNTTSIAWNTDSVAAGNKHLIDSQAITDRNATYINATDLRMWGGTERITDSFTVAVDTNYVTTSNFNNTLDYPTIDGTDYTLASGDAGGNDWNNGIRIGGNEIGTSAWSGAVYGIAIVGRALTGTERNRLERWLAVKAGINLKE